MVVWSQEWHLNQLRILWTHRPIMSVDNPNRTYDCCSWRCYSSHLQFPTPLDPPQPSMFTLGESAQPSSASSSSSWFPSALPLLPSPANCVMVTEALPSASHPPVSFEESIRYSATTDGTSQDFPLPATSYDQRMFGFVANPIQPGQLPSQQTWASIPPIQLAQSVTPPLTQGGSDLWPPDSMTGVTFTMTCPIPCCCFQCQTVLDMWKHVTWTHVQPNPKESGIKSIVERVLFGELL